MLVAVPYGALADRTGHKTCLLFATVGVLVSEIWTRSVCDFHCVPCVVYVVLMTRLVVFPAGMAVSLALSAGRRRPRFFLDRLRDGRMYFLKMTGMSRHSQWC